MVKTQQNLCNKTFGKLTAIELTNKKRSSSGRYWMCICECGNTSYVTSGNLIYGTVKSCGCTRGEKQTKHGQSKRNNRSRLYSIWASMLTRCNNKKSKYYNNYGGRGINVCDEWKVFENFYNDVKEKYRPDLQLERINNNKGYFLDNIKWATKIEQANNKRNSVRLKHNGKTQTVAMWARELKMSPYTIYTRIKRGLPPEECLKPVCSHIED